jgi:PAS domain S-box-containing protein
MISGNINKKYVYETLFILISLSLLYLSKKYNYLLFHSIIEFLSAFVFVSIFILIWNLRKYFDDGFFVVLCIASLFSGTIDILHLLSYKGIVIFPGFGTNLPTQLWIAGRFMLSFSLIAAGVFSGKRINFNLLFSIYLILFVGLVLSIFYLKIFPACYIEGQGLTSFKKISEYVISAAFAVSIAVFYINRSGMNKGMLILLVISMLASITAELFFTVYEDPYSNYNFAGHVLKIISVYLIYRAIIQKGLRYPMDVMFRSLTEKEESLKHERDKLKLYLDNSAEIVMILDPGQKITMINRKGCEILGFSENEITGKDWIENFIPEAAKDGTGKIFDNLVHRRTGDDTADYFENPVIDGSGKERLIAWHVSVLRDVAGNIISILNLGNDITKKRQIEEQVIHLASFPELDSNPICEITLDGEIEYLNHAIMKLFPEIAELKTGHEWFSSIDEIKQMFLENNQSNIKREIKIGDLYFDQNIIYTDIYKRIRIYGHDITDRKFIEMELRKNEEMFRLVLDNSPIAVSSQDKDLVYTWVYNSRLGYVRSEIIGKTDFDILPDDLAREVSGLKRNVLAGRKEVRQIVRMRSNESDKYFDIAISPFYDEKLDCNGITTITIDITEDRLMEETNVLSKLCMDKAAEAYIWVESDARIIYANEKACQMYGYSFDILKGMTIHDIAPDFGKDVWQDKWDSMKRQGSFMMESVHISRTGSEFPVETIVNYVKFDDREFSCFIIRDITERKKIEDLTARSHNELEFLVNRRTKELAEKNEMLNEKIGEMKNLTDEITEQSRILEVFFKHTMTSLVFLDKNFNFIRVNDAYARSCQMDQKEFAGKNHFDLFPSEELKEKFSNVLSSHETYQVTSRPFVFPDHPEFGTTYWDLSVVPISDKNEEIDCLVFALNDVTERIRAVNSLRESEAMFRTVLENLPVGIWVVDKNGDIVHMNPAGRKIWEADSDMSSGNYHEYRGWWYDSGKLIGKEEWASFKAITKGETIINEEIEIECFDGTHKIISNSALPIKNSENEITGAIIINQEISRRKQREKRMIATNKILQLLEKSKSKYEYLEGVLGLLSEIGKFEYSGMRLVNDKGRMPYVSFKGFDRETIDVENTALIEQNRCLCARMASGSPRTVESQFLTEGGSFYCNNYSDFISEIGPQDNMKCIINEFNSVLYVPINYENKTVGMMHFADKNEGGIKQAFVELVESLNYFIGEGIHKFSMAEKIQETEKELLLAKRLSDIGALAATVAHELRNPLAAIRMAAYNIKNKAKNPDLEKHIMNIDKKVSEGDQIIKNLLFYTRIKTVDLQKSDLFEILNDCIESVHSRLRRDVVITNMIGNRHDMTAEVDSLLIKELFENILINAYDAMMNKKGELEIGAVINTEEVLIYFKDNGCGIDKEDIDRVFDPFFSTKSKGTGLGLSVCRQIVTLHHGNIGIESRKDEGTTISVTLPLIWHVTETK